jgi:hypothetical protein
VTIAAMSKVPADDTAARADADRLAALVPPPRVHR